LNTSRFDRLIADWSVENMNPDVIPYRMLYVVSISDQKLYKDAKNIKLEFDWI
jgi:hypothetical protein